MHKLFLSIIFILISIIIFGFLIKKYQLSKNQILIFVSLLLFWLSISVIRSYRKEFAAIILDNNIALISSITAAYGLSSLFLRFIILSLSNFWLSRKRLIQIILFLLVFSSLMVIFKADYLSLYFSSFALGIGASALSLFNIIFSNSFKASDVAKSVSILALAPLMAEFLVAPIQYLATSIHNYYLLYFSSILFAIIAFIFLSNITLQQNLLKFETKYFKEIFKLKNFFYLIIVALIVAFVKFNSSGANMIKYAFDLQMPSFYRAYLDVLFSSFQLLASLLMGLVFYKYLTKTQMIVLAFSLFGIYNLLMIFNTNIYLIFILYAINAFAYGIAYNLLITLVIEGTESKIQSFKMAFFQSLFAIGIYLADKIHAFIVMKDLFKLNLFLVLIVIIGGMIYGITRKISYQISK